MAKLNNGKLIDGRYHSGEEIIISIPKGRRPVYIQGKVVKNLDPRKNYSPEDMERIRVMPDRSKGGFFRTRSGFSKRVIREQVFAVSKYLFKENTDIDFDDKRCDWMTITRYVLPDGWTPSVSALMILFPGIPQHAAHRFLPARLGAVPSRAPLRRGLSRCRQRAVEKGVEMVLRLR